MLNYSEYSDKDLHRLSSMGDRFAEEQLVERYSRLVRICARPYFLAFGDSEDLTQEGMLGLLSAIREFDQEMNTPFRSYAELCIGRRLLTAVKSASRLKHAPLNYGLSLDVLSDENDSRPALFNEAFRRIPEEQVLARESAYEFFHTYSRCLSKLEAQILNLYLDGLSYSEMAVRVNKSLKSMDNAVQRIRRKLARCSNHGDIS